MKSHVPIIATVSAVVLGLLLIMCTATWLEDPQEQSYRLIDEQVDLAQRMLANYAPLGTRLTHALGTSATQPADVPSEQWQTFLNSVQQDSVIQDSLRKQSTQIRTLAGAFEQLDGEIPPSVRPPGSSSEAYRQFADDLKQNETQIADALKIVRAAIQNNTDGSNHPAATRLEAVLCYHQADLQRRQAAIWRSVADESHATFTKHVSLWRELDASVRSLEDELRQPSEAPDELAVEQTPATTPATDVAIHADEHEGGNAAKIKSPSLADRAAKLKARQAEVATESRAAQKEVQRLTEAIAQLEQRITDAKAQAHTAEQRMFELEEAGVDPSDPESLNHFIEAYNAASAANRIAFRESTILQQGALRNAHVDTTNEDEMLTLPLVPTDPDRTMVPERGMMALQSDLKAAQALVQTQEALAKEIDRQIEELSLRRAEFVDRQARLRAEQSSSAEQAAQAAHVAIAAVIKADVLENEAITLVQGQGVQAAQQAQSAAKKRISDARARNAEGNPDSPNPRLLLITRDGFTVGHASTIAGDLNYVLAQIYAQRTKGYQLHSQMLADFESIGLQITMSLLPDGQTTESVPESAVKSVAAMAASEEAQTAAVAAAEAAIKQYTEADEPLKQLWVLHAKMGAVYYLWANVTSGSEAQQRRDKAREEYQRALHNREDRPEAPIYKTILAGLMETN